MMIVLTACTSNVSPPTTRPKIELSSIVDRDAAMRLAVPLLLGQHRDDGVTFGDFIRTRITKHCGAARDRRYRYDLRHAPGHRLEVLLFIDDTDRCPELTGFNRLGALSTRTGAPVRAPTAGPMANWLIEFLNNATP